MEMIIAVTAGMGFLLSFYLFYFYPVMSERRGKPLSASLNLKKCCHYQARWGENEGRLIQ